MKQILDVLRTSCKNHVEPYADLCAAFNKETKDGYKMDKYSSLLADAIDTIVDVKEEKDLQSLFQNGSSVLFQQSIKGLDDFELIAFVVIK